MATIDDYADQPEQALIDAVINPGIRQYITPDDIEVLTVTLTDGTQAQVQALSRKGVRAVMERILARAQALQVDLGHWVCSPDEFNWCAKLRTPVGARMRQLDAFLQNKLVQGGVNAAGLVTLFTLPAVGVALTIFGALGFINSIFVDLCHCPQ
jgi:hypothetical protein